MNQSQNSKLKSQNQKIYTRTGDRGETSIWRGQRVSKDHPLIEVLGNLDELNSMLGWVRSSWMREKSQNDKTITPVLKQVQKDLFLLGACLAGSRKPSLLFSCTLRLEKRIDALSPNFAKLAHFLLPGGSLVASQIDLARTVCRRAERSLVKLSHAVDDEVAYLNRLSDFLFILARWVNQRVKIEEEAWTPPRSSR